MKVFKQDRKQKQQQYWPFFRRNIFLKTNDFVSRRHSIKTAMQTVCSASSNRRRLFECTDVTDLYPNFDLSSDGARLANDTKKPGTVASGIARSEFSVEQLLPAASDAVRSAESPRNKLLPTADADEAECFTEEAGPSATLSSKKRITEDLFGLRRGAKRSALDRLLNDSSARCVKRRSQLMSNDAVPKRRMTAHDVSEMPINDAVMNGLNLELEDLPEVDEGVYPEIPTAFDTKFVSSEQSKSGEQTVRFLSRICSKEDVQIWLKEYKDRTGSEWLMKQVTYRDPEQKEAAGFVQYFRCRLNGITRKNKASPMNFGCKMMIRFNVNPETQLCVVNIAGQHNHSYAPGFRRPSSETVEIFESYCRAGMKVPQARKTHEKLLRERPDFCEAMLQDTSVMPNPRQVGQIYEKYKKQHPELKQLLNTAYIPKDAEWQLDDERLALMQDTARTFHDYFHAGMSVVEALEHHESVLRGRPDFVEEMLGDPAYMPKKQQAHYFLEKFKRHAKADERRSMARMQFANSLSDATVESYVDHDDPNTMGIDDGQIIVDE